MKTSGLIMGVAVTVAVSSAGNAWAVRVDGAQAPSPETVQQVAQPSAAASHADDSSSLREGVITAVGARRDSIEVNGSWLKLADGQTRLFRQGRPIKRDELAKGQKVKFTLAPSDAQRATVGTLYVP